MPDMPVGPEPIMNNDPAPGAPDIAPQRSSPDSAELLALAVDYENGLQKMVASGYEEFGPDVQRHHQLVIDALRHMAGATNALSCGAESNRHSGAVGAEKRAEQSNPGGGHEVTGQDIEKPYEQKAAGMNPRPAADARSSAGNAELLALAADYEAGLKKMVASGYEEFGPDVQRRHQLVIDALRFQARDAAQGSEQHLMQAAVQYRRKDGGYGPRWITMAMFDGQLAAEAYCSLQRTDDKWPFEYRAIELDASSLSSTHQSAPPVRTSQRGRRMSDDLTFAERLLLYMLVDHGARYDDDTIEDRVLVNRGLAERYANPFTGHGMVRVTEAGRQRASAHSRPQHPGEAG